MPKKSQDKSIRDSFEAPTTLLERKIADIYISILGIDRVGMHDDFFQLGGDSLQAIWLLAVIQESFNINVPISEISNDFTVARLALYLGKYSYINNNKT